jgi:hypothetical protein
MIIRPSHTSAWKLKGNISGDSFTKVVNRKSKITLKIFLRARIRAFH